MADNPEMEWKQALDLSKKMTNGHKGELFVLDLSFIPWYLLMSVTFGLVGIYVAPYMMTTQALYYENFKQRGLQTGELSEADFVSDAAKFNGTYVAPNAYQAPQQPNYQTPVQPQYQPYQAPQQPNFQASVQPQYQAPQQPTYQTPVQPQYQPYQAPQPAQPTYQAPAEPTYQAPAEPQYQPPVDAAPVQPQEDTFYQPPQSFEQPPVDENNQ